MVTWLNRIIGGESFRRFPFPTVCALIIGLLLIAILWREDQNVDIYPLPQIALSLYLAFLYSFYLELRAEQQKLHGFLRWTLPMIVAALCYFLLPDELEGAQVIHFRWPFYYIGAAILLHLLISFGTVLEKSGIVFWRFNRILFLNLISSAFFSLLLFIAFSLAFLALDHLFSIDVKSVYYGYLAVISFGIIHSIYWLSICPKGSVQSESELDPPGKIEKHVMTYLSIPVVLIYFFILFAYAIQITIQQELPQGWLGKLSLCYSGIALVVYLLHYGFLLNSKATLERYFFKYFWLLMCIPAVLLTVSIVRRISDYGFTEFRYLVVMATLCLFSWIGIFVSKNRKLQWILLPVILSLIICLVPHPFNVFHFTIKSQKNKLFSILDGNVSFAKEGIVSKDDPSIHNEVAHLLKYLDIRTNMSFFTSYSGLNLEFIDEHTLHRDERYANSRIILDALGIDKELALQYTKDEFIYLYARLNSNIDITSFDTLTSFRIETNGIIEANEDIYLSNIGDSLVIRADENISIETESVLVQLEVFKLFERGRSNFNDVDIQDMHYVSTVNGEGFEIYFTEIILKRSDDGMSAELLAGYLLK